MVLFGVLFWMIFVVVTGVMASKRGRNALGWVVLSIFLSPLLGIILLLLLGSSEDKKMERIASEEALRREIRGEKLKQEFRINRYDQSAICELIESVVMDTSSPIEKSLVMRINRLMKNYVNALKRCNTHQVAYRTFK